MKYAKWRIAPERPDAQARLTAAGYPYLVSAVLAGRSVDTPEQAKGLPGVFNNWAVFYDGKFVTVNQLDGASVEKILKR